MGNFSTALLGRGNNAQRIVNFSTIRGQKGVPQQLQNPIKDPKLEAWFKQEAAKRLGALPQVIEDRFDGETTPANIQAALEMDNRYDDGSMRPIALEEQLSMDELNLSPQDILDRAKQGSEFLSKNERVAELGTASRGIPVGGASSRAKAWARENPITAHTFGITESTPRFLYRVGGKSLAQQTLDMSQHIARSLGKVFPNVIMSNSEIVSQVTDMIQADLGNWKSEEQENSVLFNQIVMPRIWLKDQEIINGLFPAGHGDYPYLLAMYSIAKTLRDSGIKYFVFSNADEWLWQADPVMISIAQQLFDQENHMVIIGVENINNQKGGGFVRTSKGKQQLVETPRLPWEVMSEGKAPIALNTTFYICDVEYMADNQQALMDVVKSLVVKDLPGRIEGENEQIFGVDSWAGDVFSAVLNPAFIKWPRPNFLGIKDGGFITGNSAVKGIGDRTYFNYVNEAATLFPRVMSRLIKGERSMAEILHQTGYSYLTPWARTGYVNQGRVYNQGPSF